MVVASELQTLNLARGFTFFFTLVAAILAAIWAGFLEWYMTGWITEFVLKVSISAAIGTLCALMLCARGIVRQGQTAQLARRKGIWAGLVAVYLTSASLAIWGMTDSVISIDPYILLSSLLWAIVIFPHVMVFGGFLAPFLIGCSAYYLAQKRMEKT